MESQKSPVSGLWIIALALAIYAGILLAAIHYDNVAAGWRLLGVTPLKETFYDLYPLFYGFSCLNYGIDILISNPCDPLRRTVNYPTIWLSLKHLGANASWVLPWAFTMVAGFFASIIWLFRTVRLQEGVITALCLCSPAVMMGVERGNVDLLIFPLVMFGALFISRESPRHGYIGMACLMLAVVLKLYAVFAVAALLALPSSVVRQRLFALLVASVFYFTKEWAALIKIQATTPIGTELSYGIMTPWLVLTKTLLPLRTYNSIMFMATRLIVLLIVLATFYFAKSAPSPDVRNRPAIALFLAGAGIFCGSYFMTNNWDYRLVFLLLCLPYFFAQLPACILLIAALWLSAYSQEIFYLDEVLNFALWVSLGVTILQFAAQDFFPLLGRRGF